MTDQLLDPRGKIKSSREQSLASRLSDLNGKKIAFLNNSKPNTEYLFRRIEEALKQRYDLAGIIHYKKDYANRPADQVTLDIITRESDLLITGTGD